MIIRIVKMTFKPDRVEDFEANFHQNKEAIRAFEGCEHLELLKEEGAKSTYFTYSWWQSSADLENYRKSDLFRGVWAFTKTLFSEKPEAWSLKKLEQL